MIIILEGPDGSGKTTLANKLQKMYDLNYHHEGPPPQDHQTLLYYINTFDKLKNNPTVIDRFALGELVYPGLLGRKTDFYWPQSWLAFQHHLSCQKIKIHQFVCLPESDVCADNWAKEKDNQLFWDDCTFFQVYSRFSYCLLADNRLKWYDYNNPAHEIMIKNLR